MSILYISHKLEEIRSLCTKATIMRGGRVVKNCDPRKISVTKIAEEMVGTSFSSPKKTKIKKGKECLQINNLSFKPLDPFGIPIKNINLKLHHGEIIGIGGVAGNGQEEFLSLLSGELKPTKGSLLLNGEDITKHNVIERRNRGLLSAPEERLGHAAVPSMSLTENCLITAENRMKLSNKGRMC